MPTTLGNLPPSPKEIVLEDKRNPATAQRYLLNGILRPINDTIREYLGSYDLPFYSEKVEGETVIAKIEGVNSPVAGGHIHYSPDLDDIDPERSHILFCVKNKIYILRNGRLSTMRDCFTDDSRTVKGFHAVSKKRYAYLSIGDPSMSALMYKYDSLDFPTSSITGVADNGSGKCRFSYNPHADYKLYENDYVNITGTTDEKYDGWYKLTNLTGSTFDIEDLEFDTTETGTWTTDPKLKAPTSMTALNPSRLLSLMVDRLVSAGAGTRSDEILYSKLKTDGNFSDFTSSTDTDGGGQFSGINGAVTALEFYKSFTFAGERDRITAHRIGTPLNVSGSGIEKDSKTIEEGLTLDGIGVTSRHALHAAREYLFIGDPEKGIYQYDGVTQRKLPLMRTFKSELKKYDLRKTSICYDPDKEVLLVTAAIKKGIGQTVILIYDFSTKFWSIDNTKRCRQLIYDRLNKKVIGFGSAEPKVFHCYDGSHTRQDKSPIKMKIIARFQDAGRRSKLKEYVESSAILGWEKGVKKFLYNVLADGKIQARETIKTGKFDAKIKGGDGGTWGGGEVPGAGGQKETKTFAFKRHLNEDPLDDASRFSIEIEEESAFKSFFGIPEFVVLPTDDTADEV